MAEKKTIKHFLLRTLVALLPVIAFFAIYVAYDPYRVIWNYDDAYSVQNDTVVLTTNAGYRATQNYLHYNPERHFDSFIFGSSMSQNYKAEYWQPYLHEDASIYHYDASAETIVGIINKVKFLKSRGVEIRHALVVIEEEMLSRYNDQKLAPLFAQHPRLTPEIDYLQFHWMYFNMFKRQEYVVYLLTGGKNVESMVKKRLASKDVADRIPEINENYYNKFDSLIANCPEKFFTAERLKDNDYQPKPQPIGSRMNSDMEQQLQTLAQLLDGVDYLIIMPPRYNHKSIDSYDLVCMKQIFGAERVYNYSDDPRYVNNERCYYDLSGHMTSEYCKQILDEIYQSPLPRFIPKR